MSIAEILNRTFVHGEAQETKVGCGIEFRWQTGTVIGYRSRIIINAVIAFHKHPYFIGPPEVKFIIISTSTKVTCSIIGIGGGTQVINIRLNFNGRPAGYPMTGIICIRTDTDEIT